MVSEARFVRVRRLLESRRVVWIAALLGVLLTAPSLFGGLQTEDWVPWALARRAPFSLHNVNLWGAPGRLSRSAILAKVHDQKRFAYLPWVAAPDFRATFWRPLSSLTHHLDYHAWPNHPALMHLQSLLWYALLVAATAWLLRRLLAPEWVAGLAAVLYAIDDAHGQAVGWLSNRNALIASLFGVLAIGFHDRWRREGWKPGALLGPVCLGLGLLSGEYALGAAGYLLAHAVMLDSGRVRRRVLAQVPWLLVVGAWAAAYLCGGYGVSGSGLYFDPIRRPFAFLIAASQRGLVLLLAALAVPPADVVNYFSPDRLWVFALGALVVLIAIATALRTVLRGDREARFFALGMVLSLPPACATFPEDRLLLLVGVGGAGLVASVFSAFARGLLGPGRTRRAALTVAAGFAVVHGLVAPVLLPFRALSMWRYEAGLARARNSLYSLIRSSAQSLVVLDAPDYYFAVMMQVTHMAQGKPVPSHTLWVAGTLGPITVRRIDPNAILVRPKGGFLSRTLDRLYRGKNHPMHVGERIYLGGTEIRVAEVNGRGMPMAAVFRFPWRLEDRHLVWARWQGGRYRRTRVPAVGQSTVLNAK